MVDKKVRVINFGFFPFIEYLRKRSVSTKKVDVLQESKTPLAKEEMNDIWEKMKDKGVIYGKGGVHLNVSCRFDSCLSAVLFEFVVKM